MQQSTHMIGQAGWSRYTAASYIDHKFDRRKFNPDTSHDDKFTLLRLRQQGSTRSVYYEGAVKYGHGYGSNHTASHFDCCGSTALRNLRPYDFIDLPERQEKCACAICSEVYIDIGAGDSPDVLIALSLGYRAFSVDLFPPFRWGYVSQELTKRDSKFFLKADAVELPFADNSADYISSQAMAALLKPAERMAFYREAHRVLKIGGVFSLTGCKLRCGYIWNHRTEVERARQLSWTMYSSNTGFVVHREV